MRFGLQIPNFTTDETPGALFDGVVAMATAAEETGFDSVWVMDHFYQLPPMGGPSQPMLDAYTLLGALATQTSRVRLGTMVTGVTYRNPAHLAKIVTTLDIISAGRAILGIGAAWYDVEHEGLGFDFPPAGAARHCAGNGYRIDAFLRHFANVLALEGLDRQTGRSPPASVQAIEFFQSSPRRLIPKRSPPIPSDMGSTTPITALAAMAASTCITAHFEDVRAGSRGQGLAGSHNPELRLHHGTGLPAASTLHSFLLSEQKGLRDERKRCQQKTRKRALIDHLNTTFLRPKPDLGRYFPSTQNRSFNANSNSREEPKSPACERVLEITPKLDVPTTLPGWPKFGVLLML